MRSMARARRWPRGPVFNFLLNGITSAQGYSLALTQLTGEAATGSQQATFDAMNLFIGTMLDPSSRGPTPAPGGGASGYAAEGDASAYASTRRARAARDAYRDVHQGAAAGGFRTALERVGGGLRRARRPPTATPRSAPIPRPRASSAPRSAPTIASRPIPLPVLRSRVAAPISVLRAAALDIPTCSRPARSSSTRLVRPISRRHWPMAGRTSPPTAP